MPYAVFSISGQNFIIVSFCWEDVLLDGMFGYDYSEYAEKNEGGR